MSTSVLVCRGCCCGTVGKLPEVDHAGHLERLRQAVALRPDATLRTVDCLGPCERANGVVVRKAARRWWFGDLNDDATIDTLADWLTTPAPPPPERAAHVFDQRAAEPGPALRQPERGLDLAERLAPALTIGTWTIGVPGALAEFQREGACPARRDDAHRGRAERCPAGHRRRPDPLDQYDSVERPDVPWAELVVRLGPPRASRRRITELGADRDAIRPGDRPETLFDLGLGRGIAAFMVRTGSPALQRTLRSVVGRPWSEAGREVAADLVAAPPTRVVTTLLGRIEVDSPIPPPGGTSPDGCHTHLLDDQLALGLDWPDGFAVRSTWNSGIAHYLSPSTATTDPCCE